jgi:hypothetical protein
MLPFFAVLLLQLTVVHAHAADGRADLPVSQGVNAIIEGHSIQCRVMMEDESVIKVAETLAFQILKSQRGLLTHPEDRLLIELAAAPRDPLLGEISAEGKLEVSSILRRRLTPARIASVLTGTTALSERQAIEIIGSRGHEGLRRMLLARNRSHWDEVIRIFEGLSPEVRITEFAIQQMAFALNRRGGPGDAARAETLLRRLIAEGSENGETYGLLARIYKDRYYAALENEASVEEAQNLLTQCIDLYRSAFAADTNNYYPAISLTNLLMERGTPSALVEAQDVSRFISFSLAHIVSAGRDDVWVHASALFVAAMLGRWDHAESSLQNFLLHVDAPWMVTTTRQDLERLRRNLARSLPESLLNGGAEKFDALIAALRQREAPRGPLLTADAATATGPTPANRITGEGILLTGPMDIAAEAAATGFGLALEKFQRHGRAVMDPQTFLRQFDQNLGGSLLGMTKDHHRPLYQGYANATNLETWWEGYDRMGIDAATDSQHTAHYMERITATGEPVVFLVPRGLYHSTSELSFTATEMEWILADPARRASNVVFVFGAYELMPESFIRDVFQRRGAKPATDLLSLIIRGYQRHLAR